MSARTSTGGGSDGGEGCLSCGACCFSQLDTYVPVRGDDHARLGDRASDLVWFDGNRAYLVMSDGRCAALVLDVAGEKPRFVCSVYEDRPATCRELVRGSPACEGERAEKSSRPVDAASLLIRLRERPVRLDAAGKTCP